MERVFPLEIFQPIIDEVALTGENSDLHACCVVCRDFLHLCRAHLFRNLCFRTNELYLDKLKPRLQSLIQTLNKNPYLKGFVRSISCPHRGYPGLGTGEYDEELENELKMLLELPNMHKLYICARRGYIDYQIYRPDILSYRTLIDKYLISGSLTHLTLVAVHNLPFLPILGSPYLVRLDLRACHRGILWSPEESLPQHESAIKQLKVYYTNDFPSQMIKRFRKLEQLEIGGQPNERLPSHIIQPLQEIPACFKHLKRLTSWSSMDWPTILSPRINGHVKALPAVRYLKIEFYHARDVTDANAVFDNVEEIEELELVGSTSDAHFSPIELHKVFGEMHHSLKSLEIDLSWDAFSHMIVDKAVESMSSQPKHMLESLTLKLSFTLGEHVDFNRGNYEQWRNLASLLVDRGRFPRLNNVYIRILLEHNASDEYDVVADDFLDEPLKALLETELFLFKFEMNIQTIS